MIRSGELKELRHTTQALQANVATARTTDERHNALTLKVLFGLQLFAAMPLVALLEAYRSQFDLTHELNGQSWPLLSAPGRARRRRVPLINPLLPDLARVLNPRPAPDAHAFGWRECSRFVPLHPETLGRRWDRLGLDDVWGGQPDYVLFRACPELDRRALNKVPQRPALEHLQAWAGFRQAAARLASDLGWAPAPICPGEQRLPPNVQLGEHGVFALGIHYQEAGDVPAAVARW